MKSPSWKNSVAFFQDVSKVLQWPTLKEIHSLCYNRAWSLSFPWWSWPMNLDFFARILVSHSARYGCTCWFHIWLWTTYKEAKLCMSMVLLDPVFKEWPVCLIDTFKQSQRKLNTFLVKMPPTILVLCFSYHPAYVDARGFIEEHDWKHVFYVVHWNSKVFLMPHMGCDVSRPIKEIKNAAMVS
jgi:hypothetical protein